MTVHGSKPFVHVSDSNGAPYVGAKLYVYEVTTTTLRSIYSNTGLSTPLSNPLTSDAAGNFARFYQAAGTYKLRCETSGGSLIWEHDNIDTGLGSGGISAFMLTVLDDLTAAAARTTLDVPSNTELSDLASDVAAVQASVVGIVSVPQGRLTQTSLTPVLITGVSAGSAVYYTPYIGGTVPVWNGTQFIPTAFSELTLTLTSNHVANAIYDCFFALDGGDNIIGTGPAWNTATAGAGARGSGAGTTGIVRQGGLWVNEFEITLRNGAATYTIPAKKATFLGSIHMDGTDAQLSTTTAYGQSRKIGISNAYNRVTTILKAGDSTATWTYATTSIRASNNSAANSLTIFSCLPEEWCRLKFIQNITGNATNGDQTIGIGFNSTSAMSGFQGKVIAGATGWTGLFGQVAEYIAPPSLGINTVTCLELGVTGTATYRGGEDDMVLSAEWRA